MSTLLDRSNRKPDAGKVVCKECNRPMREADLLTAPNPFKPGETLRGCPHCKQPVGFLGVCDEPGCWDIVSCGTPTPEGYRVTCHKHRPEW